MDRCISSLRSGLWGLTCALLVLAGVGLAPAAAAPIATLSVGGGAAMNINLTPDGKTHFADQVVLEDPGNWKATISLFFDPDPEILYAIELTNSTGGPLSFSFLFSQSITPVPVPGSVFHSISGGTTNGSGVGPVTVTPLGPPGGTPVDGDATTEIGVFNLSSNGGASHTNAGIDVGAGFTSDPSKASDSYPAENLGFTTGPAGVGSWDHMRLDLNLSLSGGGDIFTFNGNAIVVPEPATAAMLGLGLLGLAFAGRRR